MNRKIIAYLAVSGALSLAGFALAQNMPPGMKMDMSDLPSGPATRPFQAVDVGNTSCPVTGDKVAGSKLVEVYDGKVYHLCCADCPKPFETDPEKYVKILAASHDKYFAK